MPFDFIAMKLRKRYRFSTTRSDRKNSKSFPRTAPVFHRVTVISLSFS